MLRGLCCVAYVAWPMLRGLCCVAYVAWPMLRGLCCVAYVAWPMLRGAVHMHNHGTRPDYSTVCGVLHFIVSEIRNYFVKGIVS